MKQFKLGYIGKSFALGAVGVVGTIIAACGGGGVTATAQSSSGTVSPYVSFATSYTWSPGSGDDKWQTLEGGTASMGSGGNFTYGGYAIDTDDKIKYHQSVGLQFNHPTALSASDYIYLQVKAPANGSVAITQSQNLVIQMGNGVDLSAQANTARVFSVFVEGGAYNSGNYTYANSCSFDQTLPDSSFVSTATGNPVGLATYKISLASLTCSSGTLTDLKAGVKAITVKVLGNKDSAGRQASTTNNFLLPKVGFISFSL
jgi:hypothetical protein